jgi:hypothetical protein
MGLANLTSSRLKAFRSCKRLHHFRYDLRVRPLALGAALRFGSLWHAGQEAWWLAHAGGTDPLEDASAALRRAIEDANGELDEFDLIKAEELLSGYDLRWRGESAEVIAVEQEFSAPLVNPDTGASSRTYQIAGKIDAIVRIDGRVYIVEHKTTTMDIGAGSEYWKRLRIDGQVSMYYEGAASLGHEIEGCVYDVVQRPTLRPHKATAAEQRKYTKTGALYANQREHDETPDEFRVRVRASIAESPDRYYMRGTVVRLDEEMADHRWDVWNTAKMLREVELSGRTVRNPDACVQYGRTCDYFGVCCGEASLDDPTKFYRGESAHPELTQAKEEPPNDQVERFADF